MRQTWVHLTGRLLAAACLAAAALLAPASPASAPARLEVQSGYDGYYWPGSQVVVRVRVAADRLVTGTLEVRPPGRDEIRTRVEIPVEIPGGSVKEFVVTVPVFESGTLHVELTDSDRVPVAIGRDMLTMAGEEELVGLLPGALAGAQPPGPAPLSVEAGIARFFALDEALVNEAPHSFGSLTVIGAGPDDLDRLGSEARSALLRWVDGGGTLMIDAEPGTDVSGLPERWQPGSQDRSPAGRGEIVLTGSSMAAGRWAGLVAPTGGETPSEGMGFGQSLQQFGGRGLMSGGISNVGNAVAEDAGLRVPELRWLPFFLLVYIVVVGPVMFVILRRSRSSELAWVAIPLTAVLFTAAAYVGGQELRARHVAHGTILQTGPAGATALTFLGVGGGSGGVQTVGFPNGWRAGAYAGEILSGTPVTVRTTGDGPRARVPLNPGQFTVVEASGPALPPRGAGDGEQEVGLVISAHRRSEGRIEGTVRNTTPFEVERAGVIVGKNIARIGSLAPGEAAEWETDDEPDAPHFRLVGPDLWAQASPYVRPGTRPDLRTQRDPGAVSYALWQASAASLGEILVNGDAVAVGWTTQYRPEVDINDRRIRAEGRTMLLSRTPVRHEAGPVPSLSIRREQVRGPAVAPVEPGSDEPQGDGPLVLRYTRPDATVSPLVLRAPESVQSIEVWRDDGWHRVFERQPAPGGQGVAPFHVPGPQGPATGPQSMQEVPMDDHELPPPEGRTLYLRIIQLQDGSHHTEWAFWLLEAP